MCAQIAGLQDFRQEGPPGDIGVFQAAASIIVYQFTFSGVTYTVAQRMGVRGWILAVPSNIDASTVINAAITALAATGGKIFITKGIYSISATININQMNVELEGEVDSVNGMQDRAVKFLATAAIHIIEINAKYCGLRNLWICGGSGSTIGLKVTESMCTVKNMLISGITGYGLYVVGTINDSIFEDVYAEYNADTNIYLIGGYNILLFHCTGWASTNGHGVRWDSLPYMGQIIACRMGMNGLSGYYFYDVGSGVNGQNAIHMSDSWTYRNQQHGLWILRSSNIIVTGNSFEDDSQGADNASEGIMLQTFGGVGSSYNIITNNIIRSTGLVANSIGYGIREFVATDDYNIIALNQIAGAGIAPILPNGPHSRVHNNPNYNPKGNIATPYSVAAGFLTDAAGAQAFPTTATNYTVGQSPKLVTIYGGTITSVSIDGVATGQAGAATFAAYRLEPGQILSVVWTIQPSSVVYAC